MYSQKNSEARAEARPCRISDAAVSGDATASVRVGKLVAIQLSLQVPPNGCSAVGTAIKRISGLRGHGLAICGCGCFCAGKAGG